MDGWLWTRLHARVTLVGVGALSTDRRAKVGIPHAGQSMSMQKTASARSRRVVRVGVVTLPRHESSNEHDDKAQKALKSWAHLASSCPSVGRFQSMSRSRPQQPDSPTSAASCVRSCPMARDQSYFKMLSCCSRFRQGQSLSRSTTTSEPRTLGTIRCQCSGHLRNRVTTSGTPIESLGQTTGYCSRGPRWPGRPLLRPTQPIFLRQHRHAIRLHRLRQHRQPYQQTLTIPQHLQRLRQPSRQPMSLLVLLRTYQPSHRQTPQPRVQQALPPPHRRRFLRWHRLTPRLMRQPQHLQYIQPQHPATALQWLHPMRQR